MECRALADFFVSNGFFSRVLLTISTVFVCFERVLAAQKLQIDWKLFTVHLVTKCGRIGLFGVRLSLERLRRPECPAGPVLVSIQTNSLN